MRKLLVLLVVLAMSSVASAQIIDLQIASLNGEPISPVSEITIEPSDVVNLDIISDVTLLSVDAIVSIGADTYATLATTPEDLLALTFPGGDLDMIGAIEVQAGVALEAGSGNFSLIGPDIVVDHILIHCKGEGDVIVTINPGDFFGGTYDNTYNPYTGQWGAGVTIHQIPEPMTIALLGLGGLVLLRRRK